MTLDAADVIRHISTEIGSRFGGSVADEETGRYLAQIFTELGCDVETQEFGFVGWRPRGEPAFSVGEEFLACAPLLYSAATGPDGVEGRLVHHGTSYLIPGVYELPSFAIVGPNGEDRARIICEASGPAISLINPRQIFQLPQIVVGRDDEPALNRWAGEERHAHLFVDAEILPNARTRNVIARYRGSGRPERVVVCAHADTSLNTPGAYDNASGLGGLYELASHVADARLDMNIDFIAFACEEQGFYGASYYVNRLKERGELVDLRFVVNLDQISGGDYLWIWVGPEEFEQAVRGVLGGVGGLEGHEVRFSPPMPGADDWIFAVEGVPTVSLIFWRLDVYHKPADTYARVDLAKVRACVDGAFAILEAAASGELDNGGGQI